MFTIIRAKENVSYAVTFSFDYAADTEHDLRSALCDQKISLIGSDRLYYNQRRIYSSQEIDADTANALKQAIFNAMMQLNASNIQTLLTENYCNMPCIRFQMEPVEKPNLVVMKLDAYLAIAQAKYTSKRLKNGYIQRVFDDEIRQARPKLYFSSEPYEIDNETGMAYFAFESNLHDEVVEFLHAVNEKIIGSK